MQKILLFLALTLTALGGIGFLFWEQEYKYTLPTPIPQNLKQVETGDSVEAILPRLPGKKGVFVHFYNYDCPCSRFNITEFQSMVRRYSDDIQFIAVLQSEDQDPLKIEEFKKKYDLGIEVIDDPDGSIADALGIYSTPQAVLIQDHKIYYKGNYNRARFCVSRNTKFAEIALDAMLNGEEPPYFPEVALTAYGCELPSNSEANNSTNLLSIF
ncbi:TlpA family protein disulfide reductase [Fulvivirga sedimenti]|uniref:Redoxin domain-containing protein n=1 Tax=Fulvivirga sedimenti TaxID=2879465 RepID=A0A9X1HS68_9BACT|nr:redoxin domain-containing protein [Fulvivirga sedimenti]MCA6074681.1 redoxin domain-containing protein [Fulvivirga sedimenti]MCA6075858.1 redoxin domain-containing protein [Fulvivirga sedimenti]MCA6076986.1 redoxin domain-containing protein [Fulvivirga sedimenti]